jgi:hypothetical protein
VPAAALLVLGQLELGLVVELQRPSLARDLRPQPEQLDVRRLHVVEVERQPQLEQLKLEQLQLEQLPPQQLQHQLEQLQAIDLELLELVLLDDIARRFRVDQLRLLLGKLTASLPGRYRRYATFRRRPNRIFRAFWFTSPRSGGARR